MPSPRRSEFADFRAKTLTLLQLDHGRRREDVAVLRAHFDRDLFVAGRLEGLGEIDNLDVPVSEGFTVVLLCLEITDGSPRSVVGTKRDGGLRSPGKPNAPPPIPNAASWRSPIFLLSGYFAVMLR